VTLTKKNMFSLVELLELISRNSYNTLISGEVWCGTY